MEEKTLAILKPSCVKFAKQVETAMISVGLKIETVEEVQLPCQLVKEFYAEHKEKQFYKELVKMLSSAPVRVYRLSGENAIQAWRNLIGPTNPNDKNASPDQLRKRFADGEAYAAGSPDNGFHGSANPEDAERELGLMKKWGILE